MACKWTNDNCGKSIPPSTYRFRTHLNSCTFSVTHTHIYGETRKNVKKRILHLHINLIHLLRRCTTFYMWSFLRTSEWKLSLEVKGRVSDSCTMSCLSCSDPACWPEPEMAVCLRAHHPTWMSLNISAKRKKKEKWKKGSDERVSYPVEWWRLGGGGGSARPALMKHQVKGLNIL